MSLWKCNAKYKKIHPADFCVCLLNQNFIHMYENNSGAA